MATLITGLTKLTNFKISNSTYNADFISFKDASRDIQRLCLSNEETNLRLDCSHVATITLLTENNKKIVLGIYVPKHGLEGNITVTQLSPEDEKDEELQMIINNHGEIFHNFFEAADDANGKQIVENTNNEFSIESIENHTVTIDDITYEFIKLDEVIDFTESNEGVKTYATHLILRTPLNEETSEFYCIVQESTDDGDETEGLFYFGHKVASDAGPVVDVTDEEVHNQLNHAFFTTMTYFIAKQPNEPLSNLTEPRTYTPFTVGDIRAAIEGLSDDTHVRIKNFDTVPKGIIPDIDMYKSETSIVKVEDGNFKDTSERLPLLMIDLASLKGSYTE